MRSRVGTRQLPGNRNLLWTADSVSDGSSDADYVVGAEEIGVIENVVKTSLRPNENISPNVVADTGSQIDEEVVGARVARAVRIAVIRGLVTVEASGLPPDPAKKVSADFLIQPRLIHAINIEKDRAIGLAQSAEIPDASPGCVKPDSRAFMKDYVGTQVGIQSTSLGTGEVGRTACAASRRIWREYCAKAEHGIGLLS